MRSVDLSLVEATFSAMGSSCRIVCDLDDDALVYAVHRIEDLESRWSRFRPTSELSACNAAAGNWVEVSAITVELVERAVVAFHLTSGRFNPMMLKQLHAIGYRDDFAALPGSVPWQDVPPVVCSPSEIETAGGAIRLPAGSAFDPGGSGKGLAADVVADDLVARGATWVVVSLGGDMRLAGSELTSVGATVAIEAPAKSNRAWGSITAGGGGIATSSTSKRRWDQAGTARHHLLDPQSGEPATTPRTSATVKADSAWWADVIAKCVVVDPTIGREELVSWNTEALAFDLGNRVELLGLDPIPADR